MLPNDPDATMGWASPIRFRCPHCATKLEAPGRALGREIACPSCKKKMQVPITLEEVPARPSRERQRIASFRKGWSTGTWLLIVLPGAVILFGLLVAGKYYVGRLPPSPPRSGLPVSSDPYPRDCAAVRQWLTQSYHETIHIDSWGKRTTFHSQFGDSIHLSARFRVGDSSPMRGTFTIGAFGTVESALIDD